LFLVDWVLHFEVDFVFEVQPEVVFVDAESVLVFAQDIQISFLVFVRDLQMAKFLDFIPGKSLPLHFQRAVVDVLTNGRYEVICERNEFLFFNLHNDVISFIRSAVFQNNAADIVVVLKPWVSWEHKCWPHRWPGHLFDL
jgi:hypothetical protein